MVSVAEYNRIPDREWRGVKVRSLVDMSNGWFTAPAGTLFEIIGKQGGFALKAADNCHCCGLRGHINKVRPGNVERAVDLFNQQGSET